MNELSLFLQNEKVNEIRKVFEKHRNHLDFVFITKTEKDELENLCSKLKYYYLEQKGFFTRVQPYFDILLELKENNRKQGYVYFIQDKKNGFIKVGRTNNVKKRMSQLSSSNNNLELLKVIKTDNAPLWEKELHKFYKNKKQFREWFSLNKNEIEQGLVYLAKRFNAEIDANIKADC